MKKTLFLSAILGAALCSSAFAEHNYSWTTSGATITPADNGTAITYGSVIDVNTATTETISGDVKVKSTGDGMPVDLRGADSIYISEGRVHLQDAAKLGNAAVFVKGGTLWVRCAEVSNDLYLGTSTYTNSGENCDKSALRLQNAGGSITLSGTITLGEDARINATQNTTVNITGDINGAGKALSLTAFYGNPSRFNLSGTNTLGTLNIAETQPGHTPRTADVTISGGTTTAGRLTLGLATDASLTVANGAVLTVTNGASLAKTITNNGTLNLAGNVTISGLTPTADSAVYFGDTVESTELNGNGYLINGTRKYQLVSGSGTLNASTATFSDEEMSGGTCDASGLVTISKVDGSAAGTYYVNNGSLDYTATSAAASAATTVIKTTKTNTTITIANDAALTASKLTAQATTKLSGSGLYVAGSAQTLGNNVSLNSDWTGTVQLTGALDANANFYQTAANENSTLEMKGVTGWFYNWYDVRSAVNANIKLTDVNANTLAWVNGAFGGISNHAVSTFTGTWSGTGSFRTDVNNDREMNYTYSGDISAWTGKFIYGGKGDLSNSALTFTGSATDVKIAIEKATGSKGTFKVVADTNVTFSKDITANSLTVNEGKTVDLGTGTLTLGSMTLGNASTVNFHSSEDWVKSEVALTTGNGYGHVGISKTLDYNVTDNGATVTVDALDATLTDNVLSSTTAEETNTYYINAANQNVAINKAGESTLNAGTYSQTEKVEIGTNNASAENASAVVLSGVTSLTTNTYLEVFHNSSLELNDTAHVEVTNNEKWNGAWLHNGSSITMAEGASLTVGSLTIQGGTITGTGDAQIGAYQHQAENATITGSTITVAGTSLGGHKIVGGSVTVNSGTTTNINSALSATTDLTVNSGSTANLNAAGTKAEDVTVNGDLTVKAASTVKQLGGVGTVKALADLTVTEGNVELGGLEIAGGKTVTLGTEESHNKTITLNSLTVGAAGAEEHTTLNANLKIADSGTMDFSAGGVLTMGCDVTIGNGVTVTLSSADYALLTGHGDDVFITLFDSVESFNGPTAITVTDGTPGNTDVFFLSTREGANGTEVGIVPEPATATLSLLALAALAARRKRK